MRSVKIGPNEAGQRLDKFLHKYMKEAQTSFFYKMMRKKNIVLNGAKCTGNEKLSAGDEVKFFLAEETLEKFGAGAAFVPDTTEYDRAYRHLGVLTVLYENEHILAVDKPAGVLSQKAAPADLTLNEWLTGYLLSAEAVSAAQLATFRPAVCNRLDRNTSGIVLCGKSLTGSRLLTQEIREHRIRKFYRLIVAGEIREEQVLDAWLKKNDAKNQVEISKERMPGASLIKTGIRPIRTGMLKGAGPVTYAEVELFTGKTHQIRAHLSWLGHPLLGDFKYGSRRLNDACTEYGIRRQLLHAYRVSFPVLTGENRNLFPAECLTAPLPQDFEGVLDKF